MNTWTSWGLAIAALVVGYTYYGPQGILLAFTLIIFWLLLQFSRVMRVMTRAGKAPIGFVDNAVTVSMRLRKNMPLVDVIKLTKSLGQLVSEKPETYRWADDEGAEVHVVFEQGRTSSWSIKRPAQDDEQDTQADQPTLPPAPEEPEEGAGSGPRP